VEHKTIYGGLRISGMAFSNQSEPTGVFQSVESQFKNVPIIPDDGLQKIANSRRWLTKIGQIPAYDKP